MERTGDFEHSDFEQRDFEHSDFEQRDFEADVHEEPEHHDDDPAHAEPGLHSGLTLWLGAALFLMCVALFFYALGSCSVG
jgi:hypothetical protein